MADEKYMISFSHVTKSYGETMVLDDFSVDIGRGEFLAIIGRSGCGKTTAMKMVNGLLVADEGQVFVDGADVSKGDLIALRRRIGYAIQSVGLMPHMTIAENIAYVPSLSKSWTKEKKAAEVTRLLRLVDLDPSLAERFPKSLSGGQRQRVGIARALAAKPEILLMDEPFGAVDEITRRGLQKQLLILQKELGLTVLFVTHDIREALKLGDRILVMENGQVLQLGTAQELQTNPEHPFVKELVCDHLFEG